MSHWQKNMPTFVAKLPVVEFPFDNLPDVYVPQRTVLRLSDGKLIQPYLCCYLERRTAGRDGGGNTVYNPTSLSPVRVAALPQVIERLSMWCRFKAARAASIVGVFRWLLQFLAWADSAENKNKFEAVLTDADLAHEALKGHHTYLRQLLQAHRISHATAAGRDQGAIAVLCEIHGRSYKDDIEPLSQLGKCSTEAPREQDVEQFMATLQAVFDSAARQILRDGEETQGRCARRRVIRLSATDDSRAVTLPQRYTDVRLMELACVAFAGLAIGDSGANLAQIQAYEEPEDLQDQLGQPERINLRRRVIKFRAGGKLVPVYLTSTTVSRLGTYLRIRERLVAQLGGGDIAPLFVQCRFGPRPGAEPVSVRALDDLLLKHLRNKLDFIGGELPAITLRQLRAYKQQHLLRKDGVKVAAELMGHSVATAIAAYSRAEESVRLGEMGQFLRSLISTVLTPSRDLPGTAVTVGIASGSCAAHGKPEPTVTNPVVEPNCSKAEGCFFCAQYRVHADEIDLRKLLSCRAVLQRVTLLQGESLAADRVYVAVLDRIDMLLAELRRRMGKAYEQVERDVQVAGNLSRYWAVKLQQLHLLGMLTPAA